MLKLMQITKTNYHYVK